MKSKFTWVMTLCLALFIQISYAQEKTISGTVVSKTDKSTIPGVNVLVKGTNRGVQTDFNGEFTIKASVGEVLVISSLGLKTQNITVGSSNKLSIQMEEEATKLEDVVVEGYNVTRTKANSNVSSVTISAKTIENRPNSNFMNSLQGQVAGVNVFTSSGDPGAAPEVRIRGVGSLTGERDPLYVVDGVPLNSNDFQSLDPNQIESVTVLKDAGAASVYGNRGANGVIVIKTKRGKYESNLQIRYSGNSGLTYLQKDDLNMMNSQQLLTFERDNKVGFGYNYGGTPIQNPGDVYVPKPMTDAQIAAMPNTDWRKTFFRTGLTQSHDLSLTSGGANTASFTSFGYFNQEGTVPQSSLQRFTFRNNFNGKSSNDKFNYSTNLTLNYSRNKYSLNIGSGSAYTDPTFSAIAGVPYLTPGDYHGSDALVDYYLSDPAGYNGTGYVPANNTVYAPIYTMDTFYNSASENEQIKAIGGLEGSYKLTKDLTFSSSLGVDYIQNHANNMTSPLAFIYQASSLGQSGRPVGDQDDNFSYTGSITAITKLNYNKKFGKNTIDATLFWEYNKYHTKSAGQQLLGFDPKQAVIGLSTGYTPIRNDQTYFPSVSFGKASTGLLSYFGTADYDYDGRFGVGASLRRDASSKFSETNRWGTFYSVTGRWNIMKENFMENSGFSLLKLRGSYGTTGSQNITGSLFSGLNLQYALYSARTGYNNTTAYAFSQIAITDLEWETTTQADLGIDFECFNRKFSGSLDVYRRRTEGLYQQVPISPINGTDRISKNFGALENRGVELLLKYDLIKSYDGFNFSLKGNVARNWNEVLDVASDNGIVDPSAMNIVAEGHTYAEFYAVKYIGVNPANGNLLFRDKNGNPTENPTNDDRVYTGKTVAPKVVGGFGFDSGYKGFYLNTNFSYAYEQYAIAEELGTVQNPLGSLGIYNLSTDMLRAWTPTNVNTDIPSISAKNLGAGGINNDRYIRDASYLRLKNVTLGYDFPKQFLTKSFISSLKLYTMAENLVTFTKWRGLDVESNTSAFGYPVAKIYTLGLQLEF